jgi:hypothetical protein
MKSARSREDRLVRLRDSGEVLRRPARTAPDPNASLCGSPAASTRTDRAAARATCHRSSCGAFRLQRFQRGVRKWWHLRIECLDLIVLFGGPGGMCGNASRLLWGQWSAAEGIRPGPSHREARSVTQLLGGGGFTQTQTSRMPCNHDRCSGRRPCDPALLVSSLSRTLVGSSRRRPARMAGTKR